MRCIRTNAPAVESHAVTKRLEWRGRSFQLVVSAIPCDVKWYEIPERGRWRKRIPPVAGLAVLVLLSSVVPCVFVPMFLLLIYCVLKTVSPSLNVQQYDNGHFWLSGCSDEFLASLSDEIEFDPIPGS